MSEAKPPVIVHSVVEGLLGAATSLETSSKILLFGTVAWEPPSMHTTCHPRYIPVVTIGPGCTERREGGPHKNVVDVDTMVVMATRELLVSLRPPGSS